MSREPATELLADRYELGDLVASGGMGTVHRGTDTKLDRAVAIKFLRADMAGQEDLRSRFEAEARAAGRLSHPNVVAVFDTGEHEGAPFIVMELLSGRTLADEAAAGPATQDRAREVLAQILSALRASHGQGILHRDLKPGNVLVTSDGSVKVTDFGVAKMAEGLDLTVAGMMLGTPAYLAPERIAGEPATEASDIYSLGVVIYEFLAGRKPFEADTPLGLIRAIQDDPVPPLEAERPDLDPLLLAVVNRAMARDPAQRYPSAAAAQKDLIGPPAGTAKLDDTTLVEGTADPTRVIEAPGSADPTGVIDAPGSVDRTGVFEAPGSLDRTDPTLVGSPAPASRASVWTRMAPRQRIGVVMAGLLVVVSLIFARSLANPPADIAPAAGPSPAEAGDPASPGGLPAPLEDALGQLEEAVSP